MMRLFRCRCLACCNMRTLPRRRRISILGAVLALVIVAVTASWMMLDVLEHTSPATSLHGQVIYAEYHSPLGATNPRNLTTVRKSDGQHVPLSNSRLPKELTDSKLNYDGRSPSKDDKKVEPPFSEGGRETVRSQEAPAVGQESRGEQRVVGAVNDTAPRVDVLGNKKTTLKAPAESDVLANVGTPSMNGPDSLQLLWQQYLKYNTEQVVLNADKFPALAPDGLVLVVQVHRRDGYLRQLLQSLKSNKGIEKVLLILSHDYFYDEMNQLVQSIDFCRVIQIYYPFSMQLFPDQFPGQSKGDCPRDLTKEQAEAMNCTNALHPDMYGHYREAAITAIKHHWWWKANMVFDKLRETSHFNGSVLFLEEDHYVSPDFINVTKKLEGLRDMKCPDCDFINLGMYSKLKSFAGMGGRASVGVWNAGKNNMGFGMNRASWNTIKGCREDFCTYDDYNWDWSLNSLGKTCLHRDLKVMVVKAPRIFHIGTCGIHHKKQCNEASDAKVAQMVIDSQKEHLFPQFLQLDPGTNPAAPRKPINPYGGWGDTRDHQLCRSFSNGS